MIIKKLILALPLIFSAFSVQAQLLTESDFSPDELAYVEMVYLKGAGMPLNNQISLKNHFCASTVGFQDKVCVVSNLELLTYVGELCIGLNRSGDDSCPVDHTKAFYDILKEALERPNDERLNDVMKRCIDGNSSNKQNANYPVVLSKTGGAFSAFLFAKHRNLVNVKKCIDANR